MRNAPSRTTAAGNATYASERMSPAAGYLEVCTSSRLHFGLWTLSRQAARRYGGVGAMVTQPRLRLRLEPAAGFGVAGLLADRVGEAACRWSRFYGRPLPDCRLRLLEAPALHVGLGVGTQLALATARLLHAWWNEPLPPPPVLARSVGRGRRSAVGVYGFLGGGLIVESGKSPGEWLSPLEARVFLPDSWRFLLVRPRCERGLCGSDEEEALARCAERGDELAGALAETARTSLLPAARDGNFAAFAQALARYSALAGDCFRFVQGGRYGSEVIRRLVHWLEHQQVPAFGQSSWGPTLFVLMPDQHSAESLAQTIREELPHESLELVITAPANKEAQLLSAGKPSADDCNEP